MANTPAVYPTSLTTFTTKVNRIDVYEDDHVNKIQNEVVALQTYIGTNPHGSRGTLVERIGLMIDTNGSFFQTSGGFPASTFEGRTVWRPDLVTLFVYGNGAWNSLGQSLSNVLFYIVGPGGGSLLNTSSVAAGYLSGTGLHKWSTDSSSYGTVAVGRFKKISGISTITFQSIQWNATGAPTSIARYTVDTLVATASVGGQTPKLASTAIDVSSLVTGTTYNVVVELRSSSGSGGAFAFLHSVTAIGA